MNANFYVHGVPKGQDVWGTEQDRDYIKSFYSVSYTENVRFVVELIPARKRIFYTYLRAQNIYGSENRNGSYFGMTISFDDAYCTDNESLFALFDTFFHKRIVGSLIQNNNGNYRFITATFEGKHTDLENIRSEFLKQLDSFDEDMEKIDDSFASSANGQVAYFNISDIDNSSFFSVLQKTLKVYISPEYPTKDAKLAAAANKINSTEKELVMLRTDKQNLEEECRKLRNENIALKNDLESSKAKDHHYNQKSGHSDVVNIRTIVIDVIIVMIFLLLVGITYVSLFETALTSPIFPKRKEIRVVQMTNQSQVLSDSLPNVQ